MTISQTDQFVCDPDGGVSAKYPRQWHMTAQIPDRSATRVLAIVQVGDNKDALLPVTQIGNIFTIGDWTIEASMASISTAALKITKLRCQRLDLFTMLSTIRRSMIQCQALC